MNKIKIGKETRRNENKMRIKKLATMVFMIILFRGKVTVVAYRSHSLLPSQISIHHSHYHGPCCS